MKDSIILKLYNNLEDKDPKLHSACKDYLFCNGSPLLKLKAIYILEELDAMVSRGECSPIDYNCVLDRCSLLSGYSKNELEVFKDIEEPQNLKELRICFRKVKAGDFKGSIDCVILNSIDTNKQTVEIYCHIGQHAEASIDYVYQDTRPAQPEEYQDLLNEIEGIYQEYDIKILKRLPKL